MRRAAQPSGGWRARNQRAAELGRPVPAAPLAGLATVTGSPLRSAAAPVVTTRAPSVSPASTSTRVPSSRPGLDLDEGGFLRRRRPSAPSFTWNTPRAPSMVTTALTGTVSAVRLGRDRQLARASTCRASAGSRRSGPRLPSAPCAWPGRGPAPRGRRGRGRPRPGRRRPRRPPPSRRRTRRRSFSTTLATSRTRSISTTDSNGVLEETKAPGSSSRLPTKPLTGERISVGAERDLELVEAGLRLVELRPREVELSLSRLMPGVGVVERLAGEELPLEQAARPIEVGLRELEVGLALADGGAGDVEGGLGLPHLLGDLARLDPGQDAALGDAVADADGDLFEPAVHLARHVHRRLTFEVADDRDEVRHHARASPCRAPRPGSGGRRGRRRLRRRREPDPPRSIKYSPPANTRATRAMTTFFMMPDAADPHPTLRTLPATACVQCRRRWSTTLIPAEPSEVSWTRSKSTIDFW